ncbi:MAG: hypothetical protein EP332_04555 [Bacteroidetes bacterium]|nr:MAG: hypothetical protein EP332_04555 [Bacteroidota bacterium]
MKRKLFIGSSKEGLEIAQQLKEKVDFSCGDWIHSEIWDESGVFSLNGNTLNSLVKASRKFDYGVLVATKDDILKTRGVEHFAPRDNVMLEIGMFIGSLGLTRAFLLLEEESKLPSDYSGITVPYFHREKVGSLGNAMDQIIGAITRTKLSYNLKPMPSAALALGYFDNFIEPFAKRKHENNEEFKFQILLPKNIQDVNGERQSYKNRNPSTEKGVAGPNTRPVAFELDHQPNTYWDIPTTLSTMGRLMDLLLPSSEIGIDIEKQDWIDHELRNFAGTIAVLVERSLACNGKIEVFKI